MKRLVIAVAATAILAGCASHRGENPYAKPQFYSKYLNPGNRLDQQIQKNLDVLAANPNAASAHNDLGMLLIDKGFPKDAEREFQRAIRADRKFYPAWYNLGVLRLSNEDYGGARRALEHVVAKKPGHALALFQLGLLEEKAGNTDAAVHHYAKAFNINRLLMDVRYNPRILDSNLTHLAMLELYPKLHNQGSLDLAGAPPGYVDSQPPAPQVVAPTAPPPPQ